jgi:hypothetical protein
VPQGAARAAQAQVDASEGRKAFFLKKEAKTFAYWRARCGSVNALRDKSFLVLFFKKELLSSCWRRTKKGPRVAARPFS